MFSILFLFLVLGAGTYWQLSDMNNHITAQEPLSSFKPSNLPDLPSLFVGRETDINDITQQLQKNVTRVCIISGPPGVGKSAVALKTGHTVQDNKSMKVHYVDMKSIDNIEQLEKKLKLTIIKPLESKKLPISILQWATGLTKNTLLILDNWDHKRFDQLHSAVMAWTKGMLKVIITNQALVVWEVDNVEQLYQHRLDFLATDSTSELIEERFKHLSRALLKNEDVEDLVDVLHGMPLAIKNIVDLERTSTTCNLECIIKRLKGKTPIQLFIPAELGHVPHTVEKSIALAYNTLSDEHKQCGWHLAKFGEKRFNEAKAKETLKNKLPDTDYDFCISALTKASLLSFDKKAVVKVCESRCTINNTQVQITCDKQQKHHQLYQFHPLIRSYFRVKTRHNREKRAVTPDYNADEYTWHYVIETGLKRKYCPDLWMFVHCGTTWKDVENKLNDKMTSNDLDFTDRVQVGLLGTYWGRLVFPEPIKDKNKIKFINSTLSMFKEFDNTKDNISHKLAAYVFFNHHLLGIQWESAQEQHQCYCPKPAAIKGVKYVERLYADTSDNHLAWSARRSFYLDAFCCCRVWGKCERLWRFWIRGIVSQIAITRLYFKGELKTKCNDNTNNPVDTPAFVEGIWHYSFTKQYEKAIKFLKLYLQIHNDCPVLRVAAIMVLHDIYREQGDDDNSVEQYLTDSNTLIDKKLNGYETFYKQVVIPFLYEFGDRQLAQDVGRSLNPYQVENKGTYLTFECDSIYQLHRRVFKDFVCLTL